MHTHHGIDYIELSVTDMQAAQTFYTTAFGWTFRDYGPGYAGIVVGDAEVGGLAKVDELVAQDTAPLIVLYSSDLEPSLRSVEKAGGRILKAPFEFPGGRRFRFADPSGNQLAVWAKE